MKKINVLALLPGMLLATGVAVAQEDEAPERYTYATYLYCDTSTEDQADEYVAKFDAPVLDKLVTSGKLAAWGWMRHHTGGQWRRIRWHAADSVIGAIDALDVMGKAMEEAYPDEDGPGTGVSCKRHDDYIWKVEAGSLGNERGKVGISVYFSCNVAKEERGDEIVKESFAPVFDKLVEDGKLSSWGWQSHVIGGWFRRLHTMTAPDYETLLAARTEALDQMYGEDNAAGAEFSEICGAHHDYLWDIVHEKAASE